ncbi:MAG: Maf family protein [Pseudomonadota bacterium]
MTQPIVLASKSIGRSSILTNAGISHELHPAHIDERAIEASLDMEDIPPADIAELLGVAKAQDVSARLPGRLVIGADQTLSLADEILHKSPDMEDARKKLLKLSGQPHQLNASIAIVRDGELLHASVHIAHMHMRTLTPKMIGQYLAEAGDGVLSSVGCYQIEGPGIRLFERVDGDYFTIIGMPIFPLMRQLRELGVME